MLFGWGDGSRLLLSLNLCLQTVFDLRICSCQMLIISCLPVKKTCHIISCQFIEEQEVKEAAVALQKRGFIQICWPVKQCGQKKSQSANDLVHVNF